MRHQRIELPTNKHNKKRRPTGKQKPYKTPESPVTNQVKKPCDNRKTHKMPDCCNKCGQFHSCTRHSDKVKVKGKVAHLYSTAGSTKLTYLQNTLHYLPGQGFQCPAKKYQCKVCNKYGHFSSLCYSEEDTSALQEQSQKSPKHTNSMQVQCMCRNSSNNSYSEDSSSDESFFLQLQIQSNHAEGKQIPNPVHLINRPCLLTKNHITAEICICEHD